LTLLSSKGFAEPELARQIELTLWPLQGYSRRGKGASGVAIATPGSAHWIATKEALEINVFERTFPVAPANFAQLPHSIGKHLRAFI
jgi:hypothetical protein